MKAKVGLCHALSVTQPSRNDLIVAEVPRVTSSRRPQTRKLPARFMGSRWKLVFPAVFAAACQQADRRKLILVKGLILAQNERWRRGLGMQVERIPGGSLSGGSGERGSKAWVTYPGDWDSLSNGRVIPGDVFRAPVRDTK